MAVRSKVPQVGQRLDSVTELLLEATPVRVEEGGESE